MRRTPLLLCCVLGLLSVLASAEPSIGKISAPSWVVEPGATVPVEITMNGNAGTTLQIRAELRLLDGTVKWTADKTVRLAGVQAKVSFAVPTAENKPGDHGLRVSILRDGAIIAAKERALMLALPGDAVLLFDQEPVEKGLRFERHNVSPVEVTVDGAQTWVHQMTFGSQRDAEGWWRSVYLTLTDNAVRNGKRPVADIDVVYQHESDAPVELAADTAKGSQIVAKGWGRKPGWQVLSAHLTDALFSAPPATSPGKDRAAETCDVRFNACTGDGRIRSIRIHMPDANKPADWSRFLSAQDFSSQSGWIVKPDGNDNVTVTVSNRALVPWKGVARLEIAAANGRTLAHSEQPVSVAANGTTPITTQVTFPGEPGERLLRWRFVRQVGDTQVTDIAVERSCMVATPELSFILFERQPLARGLEITGDNSGPVDISTGGFQRSIWRATFGSASQGWWRSLRMNVTDPALQNGAAPVVDVTVQFRQRSDAPVNITADTVRGGGVIVSSWGSRGPEYERDPPWKSMTVELDDARFARTPATAVAKTDGKADVKIDANAVDGCDLRYNGCTADAEIRSIVIRRYDRTNNVVWKRMLRPLGVDLGVPRNIFAPGTTATATLKVANRALIPWQGDLEASLTDDLGKAIWTRSIPMTVAAEATTAIPIDCDLAKLPRGAYRLLLRSGELISTATWLGVSPTTKLAKARDGEYYFGMGGINASGPYLDWADFLGIDLVRNCGRTGGGMGDVDTAIALLKVRGYRGHLMLDPPYDTDAGKLREETLKRAAWAGDIARKHGDFLKWYELGNEPDLPFFYAGPIQAYVDSYQPIYAAIKAADPDSVVMNGGLCFHGKVGWDRAHELVKKFPDTIDAWAYHGHGPGANAERSAWERQNTAVTGAGKPVLTYIETESGFAAEAGNLRNLHIQAQTVVQKHTYAQSKGMPLFIWYTFGGEGAYEWGMVEQMAQPRPAALAHRVMVERLRHHRFHSLLELSATGAEGYVFHGDDNRRTLVLWSDRGEVTRTIAIGSKATDLEIVDLFGNAKKLTEAAPGLVQVTLAEDPLYVTWHSGEPEFVVTAPPPVLVLPNVVRVVPGRDAVLPVQLRNPGQSPLATTLQLTTSGVAPLRVPEAAVAIALPVAGATETLRFGVEAVQPSPWPQQWSVFAPVRGDVDLTQLAAIPSSLGRAADSVNAQNGFIVNNGIDLAALGGGYVERKQAICLAWYESSKDQTIEIGASADWWMEWYVNGKRVYSTLDTGNRGGEDMLRHTFSAPVHAGRNLLAVRVLSGSGGWRLTSGGPDEISALRRERAGERDALLVTVRVGDTILARESLPVEVLRPLENIDAKTAWSTIAPVGKLGPVDNHFMAQPDHSKWYQGESDLSGQVWVRRRGAHMVIAVAVTDDRARPGDGCRVQLASGPSLDKKLTLTATARRDDSQGVTWYEASIPAADLGADRFAVQVLVNDDDWGEEKQTATWGDGTDPERWFQSWVK